MRRTVVLVLVVLTFALAACGADGASRPAARARVPAEIVPSQLPSGLHLVEYTADEVEAAFDPKGARSLADDARVWEVRDADLLVGALQVVALAERADPANRDDRRSMVGQAIPGTPDRFDVEGVEVYAGRAGSRQLYCWFSNDLLVFLQLRGEALDGEAVVADVVRHQVTNAGWESLPPIEEEEEA